MNDGLMCPRRFGLYEKSMPTNFSIYDKLMTAAQAGFDWLEISIDETDLYQSRLYDADFSDELTRAVGKAGIGVESMCLSAHRKYPLGETDPKNLELLRNAVIFSAKHGIRIIQLAGYDTYYHESTPETRDRFFENLKKCVAFAASYGVILGFETMETEFMNTVGKAMTYVSAINSPYLCVYPDVGNIRNATDAPLDDLSLGRGHIVAAHLKETLPGIFRNLEFGQGRVDFPAAVTHLESLGVHRFTLEFWYDTQNKPNPIEYVRRNRNYVESLLTGH